MLCFAATCVATLYHYSAGLACALPLDQPARAAGHGLGGIGLIDRPGGLAVAEPDGAIPHAWRRGAAAHGPRLHRAAVLISLTGLASAGLARHARSWRLLLAVHLGVVMALFLTMPYGKFAHGIFRTAALLKWAIEKRQAPNLKLGSD